MRATSRRHFVYGLPILFVVLGAQPCRAETMMVAALADLSLEQLSDLTITSVSKQPERLGDAAASIFVITNDDIRRSGANTLPEALRLAPNLQVARLGSGTYAISARGFNNAIGNKLLVLIDGRTVYTPLYSGVFWDQQDVMLEDVERIEVISGAGGTAWGTNAVNGVINVITRKAADTQGGLLSVGGGDPEIVNQFRYGGAAGDRGSYRVYGKQYKYNESKSTRMGPQDYDWDRTQGGFRFDWAGDVESFTVQGDFYDGKSEELPVNDRRRVSGANFLTRWDRNFADGENLRVQAYYDRTEREDPLFGFDDTMETFDIEMQHGIPFGRHNLLWGAGYRLAKDDSELVPVQVVPGIFTEAYFVPEDRNLHWLNAFVQGKFSLTDDIELTAGTRFERNDYTGWEILPSMRLAWTPTDAQLVWGAVSRAVRAPARFDRDLRIDFNIPAFNLRLPVVVGGPHFRSEEAIVSEVGYRAQPTKDLSFSVTAFRHDYEYLRSGHPAPAEVDNQMQGHVHGVEAWGSYQVMRTWRLSAGVSLLRQDFSLESGSDDPDGDTDMGNDPKTQWQLRSSWDLSDQCEFDLAIRHVEELPDPKVDSYTAVDARLAWRPRRDLELSLIAQNLFDPGHVEFIEGSVSPTETERMIFVKLLWRM